MIVLCRLFLNVMEYNKQNFNNICIYVNVPFTGAIFLEFSIIKITKR
jgi:hypothetical protein